ncbi:acetophenone carboxylase [Prauserella sp. PE36]|uniref:Acetophenone carboxylase n=1 Tax=Prauserella endophytica TaxID=1592324 RepID=A0ABY2S697_9PSEU|nr:MULTISPECIES: acetone carboxylase subunit gamma [Prauserella]PXY33236.1 acetophenone carboxylase [Prauserella coralliicola]RBM16213.1 acetophenone carboxylase [Prauserella sp. PE36]TKG70814.1 acetophenone carboxylase [Prauserella endophytica]
MSSQRIRVTEYLEIDPESTTWHCERCGHAIGPASENYKRGLLLHDRDPREIHPARFEGEHSFAPDPSWCRIVEYYCPGCGVQLETEYLPPGHPLAHDIQIDVDALLARASEIREGQAR